MEAADPRLQGNFDEQQMERLMILGLCCAHPNFNSRPLMKEVISMLNFDVAPPLLPLEMPVLDYFSPSFKDPIFPIMSSYAMLLRGKSGLRVIQAAIISTCPQNHQRASSLLLQLLPF
ncbi:hypothetical protein REPUB_Repub04eG0092100 [Reevesia pubescens]